MADIRWIALKVLKILNNVLRLKLLDNSKDTESRLNLESCKLYVLLLLISESRGYFAESL